MPDIMGERDLLQSDIFNYTSVKNELEKYDTGREKGLASEYGDLAIDTVILKMIEENQMNTDPISLRENFNEMLNKFSSIFGVIKQFMIGFGQNISRRQQLYDDFEKLHPTKLVQFHKAPLWYQFLVEIASAGGRLHAADLIEMYPERYQRLINLSQDHGFITFARGGEIVQLREDICREILFREYAPPNSPGEVRNKEYFRKTNYTLIRIMLEPNIERQIAMAEEFERELMDDSIRNHVTLDWIAPLIRNNIKTIDDFIKTPPADLCRIVSDSISEVSRTMLTLICYFKRDVRAISIDVFDRGIFKKLDKKASTLLTFALHQNDINNWGDLLDIDIANIKEFHDSSQVNCFRLQSFCRWYYNLVEKGGGFYYQPLIDDFPFHENLDEVSLKGIDKVSDKTPEEYLTIADRDVVSSFKKGDLTRIPPEVPKTRKKK